MLKDLFASRTQAKLIELFVKNSSRSFYQREIVKIILESLGSVQYELKRLEKLDIITANKLNRRKYYQLNKNFFLFPELRDIILKVTQRGMN